MTSPIPGYGADLPDELILGHIAWYTITNPHVTYEELAELVEDLKLDASILPIPPRLGDAFKRACRYSERKGLDIPYSSNKANFLIRPVSQNADEIERHLVLEIVDTEGKHLEYHDAAHLRFDRTTNVLHVKKRSMPDDLDAMVIQTINLFNGKFEEAAKYIDAQVIRRMVRNQLDLMRAIGVRRQGSVYFYPHDEHDTGEALEKFCRKMGAGSDFHHLPLVNTKKQREMVKAAFEDEVHDEATQIITELSRLAAEKTEITDRAWTQYRDAFNRLKSRMGDYRDLVDAELTKADVEMGALENQLLTFMTSGLVKVKD